MSDKEALLRQINIINIVSLLSIMYSETEKQIYNFKDIKRAQYLKDTR